MSFLFHKKLVPAINISSKNIRIALLSNKNEIQYAVSVQLPEGVFKNSRINNPAIISETLTQLIKNIIPKPKEVVCIIPDSQCFTYVFKVPLGLNEEETRSSILTQSKKIIPANQDDICWDYIDLVEGDSRKCVYVGVLREIIEVYRSVTKQSGLTLIGVDIEALALGRIFLSTDKNETPHNTMIAHIGKNMITLDVFDSEKRFIYSDIIPEVSSQETDTTIGSVVTNVIITEIKNTIEYTKKTFDKEVTSIILTGEPIRVSRVEEILRGDIGISIQQGSLPNFISQLNMITGEGVPVMYASVLGGALYFNEANNNKRLEFLQEEKGKKETQNNIIQVPHTAEIKDNSKIKKIIAYIFIVLTFIILGFVVYMYVINPLLLN